MLSLFIIFLPSVFLASVFLYFRSNFLRRLIFLRLFSSAIPLFILSFSSYAFFSFTRFNFSVLLLLLHSCFPSLSSLLFQTLHGFFLLSSSLLFFLSLDLLPPALPIFLTPLFGYQAIFCYSFLCPTSLSSFFSTCISLILYLSLFFTYFYAFNFLLSSPISLC